MKQIVQELRSGKRRVVEVPAPLAGPGEVLIQNRSSLLSAGTDKALMELASASLLAKARARPDQFRRVVEKVRQEGLWRTWQQVRERLDEPMPLGYSAAGTVVAVGSGVRDVEPGARVASNSPHAGVAAVPRNLCASIPDGVTFSNACFAVLGSIALQSVRLARVELQSNVFVIGLGLVGQLVVALLRAGGVRVMATDIDPSRCELALVMGADIASPSISASDVAAFTNDFGADAVIVAAATESDGPVQLAGEAVRKKGRVVAVGAVGMNLPRRPYYFKEAEFVVSCSYGPGRYDPEYEEHGHDYPVGYVRWTEQRNMQAVLDLMASGELDPSPLISHRFPIDEAERAYKIIEKGSERYLGIILEYPDEDERAGPITLSAKPAPDGKIGIGVLGAGNFARAVMLPVLRKASCANLVSICSAGGLSAVHSAERHGFARATSEDEEVFGDSEVDAVFILTRHDQHAQQVIKALEASKHVFVEKPLALKLEEIDEIEAVLEAHLGQLLMVGFNRRFAPATAKLCKFFGDVHGPLTISVRFNAGAIPENHWTQHEAEGGGRIVGEACHAIDLATFLAGAPPTRVYAEAIGGNSAPKIRDDQVFITLRHANGSVSSVAYLAGGDKAFPKERVEVIGGGRVAVIEDFRRVIICRDGKIRRSRVRGAKGHREEVEAFLRAVERGGEAPIPWHEIKAVSRAAILAVRSLQEGMPMQVDY